MTVPGITPISDQVVSALEVLGFPPQADYSTIDVLRYLPLERFLSLLEFEAMWFSRLGALQDKFECTDPQGVRAKTLELVKDQEFLAKTPPELLATMLAVAENGRSGDGGRQMGAVNCWFIGKLESPKMWKEYGDGGKGIAIRSNVKLLTTAFQIFDMYARISRVGRVNYVDFKSHNMGNRGNDMLHTAMIKDKPYEAENEVRIITLNSFHSGCLYPDGTPTNPRGPYFMPNIKGYYIKCRLQELIRSVIVGPNTGQNFHMLMKRVVGRYGLTVDVEHSQLPPCLLHPR